MNRRRTFSDYANLLDGLMGSLKKASPGTRPSLSSIPQEPAVYVFYDSERPVYVGQTRDLRRRISDHRSSGHNKASFAFQLACDEVYGEPRNRSGKSRAAVEADLTFAQVFKKKIEEVKGMRIAFLVIDDELLDRLLPDVEWREKRRVQRTIDNAIVRTLLEVHAALALRTERYNSFDTH